MLKKIYTLLFLVTVFVFDASKAVTVLDLLKQGEAIIVFEDYEEKGDQAWSVLNLKNKNLTSLKGLDQVPGIERVKEIDICDNPNLELIKNIFSCAKSLKRLWIPKTLKCVSCYIKPWDYNIRWYANHEFSQLYGLSGNKDIVVFPIL